MFRPLLFIALYVVTGKLGLMLAQPPGYATAIFPPAGIAIATALIVGRQALPWTFFASLLLNLWIGYDASNAINAVGLGSALAIASASMLQAAAGAALLRKFIDFPPAFTRSRELLVFLLLSPIITLVSATLSIGSLWILGVLPSSQVGINWLSWWAGDTTGLVVMLPIVLAVIGTPKALWRSRLATVALPMVVTFALITVGYLIATRWEQGDSLSEFKLLSNQTYDDLRLHLELQDSLLEQIVGLFTQNPNTVVKRTEFSRFLSHSLERFSAIQAIEWAPHVTNEQRKSFEMAQRSEIRDFNIRERDPRGDMVTAGDRSFYYPVTYIEPAIGNEAAIGFDLASNPSRLAAITKASQTDKIVGTAPVTLVQENQNQVGLLLIKTISTNTRVTGVVLTVLRAGEFMSAVTTTTREKLQVRLVDVAADKTIYDTFPDANVSATWTRNFSFGLRDYRIETTPTALYIASHRGMQSWLVLLIGLFGTGLLGALLMLGTGQKAHAEMLVQERTQDLRESQEMLANAQRIANFGSWEWHLQNNYMIWSDETFRILGYDPKKMSPSFDALLQRIHPDDAELFNAKIQEALRNENNFQIENRLRLRSGEQRFVAHQIESESGSKYGGRRLVGVIHDVTARKQIDAMKSEFVSIVSHELRTPLTSIRGALGLMYGGAVDLHSDEAKSVMGVAYKNSERLSALIDDLLDMEKLVNGKLTFDMRTQALMPLVDQSVESIRSYGQQYGVTFEIKTRADDVHVYTDGSRIQQVLANLLSNAAKFSPNGDVVKVDVIQNDNVVRIAVCDHGPGIPEPFRNKIFHKFSQADSSDTRQKGGTGLGLAISKELIERMNGSINFDSVAGQGSTFYVELPTVSLS